MDLVLKSFELAAETGTDITPLIYDKYFKSSPESVDLMSHIDELVRGKMMEEVFRLLMVENYQPEAEYLNFEVKNHESAYSVEPDMYIKLLDAVRVAVKDTLRSEWSIEYEEAWQGRIGDLTNELLNRSNKTH
ncbi:MAG: globin [Pseudomonadales bacterium]|jgi:hemoglobin-like flavoprotein|tara:strand:- start:12824 stop:13222 length:399 start_codon:yes stop_codon:yes gene_type:complete